MGAPESCGLLMFISDVFGWLTTAAHWHGETGIPNRSWEHLQLCALAIGVAALVAIPLGIFFGHRKRGAFVASTVVNVGRALPSFAILAIAVITLGFGIGFWPISVTAIQSVRGDILESARGMGMRPRKILFSVELPLAAPLIIAGIRTASVTVIATAPLGALVAWGGLGRFIIDGLSVQDYPQVAGGAILVALLSIATEIGIGFVERSRTPGKRRVMPASERPDVELETATGAGTVGA
jgi:osmoprotectant transport system permease protein